MSKSAAAPDANPQDPAVTGQLVQQQTRNDELSKHFSKYDLIRMDPVGAAAQIRNRGRLLLKSSVRDFDLHLTPHDLRSPDYSAQVIDDQGVRHLLPKTQVNTYKGEVKGLPGAEVRMMLTDKGVEGAIITRENRFFIQPARVISPRSRSDEFILYQASDLTEEGASCGLTLAEEVAAQEELTKTSGKLPVDLASISGPVLPLSPVKIARISTDADGEYVNALGGPVQANTQIINILNLVDGIYHVEVGITFQIVQQNTWSNPSTDPYTSTVPGTLLTEFRNHWNANFPNSGANARSIAHLFTGKDLDGNTIGIASFGSACRSPTFAYGLSQRFPFAGGNPITAQTAALTAHEIGHNFAASHTNQTTTELPFDLERSCEQTIMEASIGNGSSFCPLSRSQIAGQATGHSSCLIDSVAQPPSSTECVPTPLGASLSDNGTLSSGDCRSPSRGVEHFADRYSFNGNAGQRLFITMTRSSGDLDPYLYLIGPEGFFVAQDDDGNGGVDSRIPFSFGTITLPHTGVYIIEATSFARQQTGSYMISVTNANCTIAVTTATSHFPAGGGNGSINVTLNGCAVDPTYPVVVSPTTEVWLAPEVTSASGTRAINFTVNANTNQAGRRAFLTVGAVASGGGPNGHIGGVRIPITQSGTVSDCVPTPIAFGQTLNGTLSAGDCHSPVRGSGFLADRYSFNAVAGQRIAIQATDIGGGLDTFLTLLNPNNAVIMVDDDSGGQTNSRLPGGNNSLALGLSGTYMIEVTAFATTGSGSYSLTLTADPVGPVQFLQSAISVAEDAGSVNVNVTRSGDVSGAATVNYATVDTAGLTSCTVANGVGSERCDYATTVGTLRFAAGETIKTITIPIVNDVLVEGDEKFTVTLSGVSGATLGTSTATVTIVDNDVAPASQNPIDGIDFFVTQQYIDFLGRLPDATGFANWVATLGGCPNGGFGEFDNPHCDRVHVSSGFYLSIEFQGRGYFAYRFYEVALDRRPTYAEFVPDMALVGGPQSPESELLSKAAYTEAWTQRAEFKSRYDGLTNAAYVNALEANAEVTLSNKQALIDALNGGQTNRGQVLRDIVETQAVADRFFNRAFVSMQYFGYLRRDPDTVGFQNWLTTLNNNPADFRHMIFGFLFSTEYRQRFGP